jgi:hypothetical protein
MFATFAVSAIPSHMQTQYSAHAAWYQKSTAVRGSAKSRRLCTTASRYVSSAGTRPAPRAFARPKEGLVLTINALVSFAAVLSVGGNSDRPSRREIGACTRDGDSKRVKCPSACASMPPPTENKDHIGPVHGLRTAHRRHAALAPGRCLGGRRCGADSSPILISIWY